MPEASDGPESSTGSVSNQLAYLVPTFDPSKDDLLVYQQKVELLLEAWPSGKYTELATRLILNCAGSAFQKLQLHQSELMTNDRKSIQRIIELLGGHWGRIDLERKYEFAERAIYKCLQKNDESADSFLARADIMWTELNSRKINLSDLQAYVTLRGSLLSSEDKKRVLIDADAVDKGELTISRVSAAIRMLGASFFQEMTTGKRPTKFKTYDQATLVAEEVEDHEPDQYAMTTESLEDDEHVVETLAQEGDDDATLVMDFESAAAELLQTDEEPAAAFTAYTDARRRLNEKVRSRGFWPVSQKGKSKGSWKGVKGKFSKGHPSSRKSLQQRILESRCRLCNQVGHWKAECPNRRDSSGSNTRSAQAPATVAETVPSDAAMTDDALSQEFLNLPVHQATSMKATQPMKNNAMHVRVLHGPRHCPRANVFCPVRNMSLADRLAKVQQPEAVPEFEFNHLSTEELANYKIRFGKTHLGKTYQKMWDTEQPWIRWFAQRYHQSSKWEHRVFLEFVERKVERCELTGAKAPSGSAVAPVAGAASKACPKAKAMTAPPVAEVPITVWDDEEDQDLFEVVPENEPTAQIESVVPVTSVSHLETRMLHMENALARVINYIEQTSHNQTIEQ
eukprot:s1270_g10.t1